MSESLPYLKAENPEDEPAIRFVDKDTGEEVLGTRENTRLYTYFGRAAFNHLFLTAKVIDGVSHGNFIWAVTPENEIDEGFDKSMHYMFENDYTMALNLLEVTENVVKQRANYLGGAALKAMQDEGEVFIPDDWAL